MIFKLLQIQKPAKYKLFVCHIFLNTIVLSDRIFSDKQEVFCKILIPLFEAGVTPDIAKNSHEFATLTG